MEIYKPSKVLVTVTAKRRPHWILPILALAGTILRLTQSPAQTVQNVGVSKEIDYVQTNATTAIVNPAPVSQHYGGPYGFGAYVNGSDLSGITPPGLTLPAGSTYSIPANFNGQLGYNAGNAEWEFGLINANNFGTTSQSQLDSFFANGTYTLVVQGTTIPLALTGNAYPNIPLATLTGGSWTNGQYVINASNALTITTSTFTNYGSNVNAYISISVNGANAAVSISSSAPLSNSLTAIVPASTLASGQTNAIEIRFGAIVNTNAALVGSLSIAHYDTVNDFQVVTLPLPSSVPTVQVVQVYKNVALLQTNATTAIVDPTPVGPGYGGPYGFQSDVIGTNLGGITAPGLTLPGGSTYNGFNGKLTYAGVELSFAGVKSEWSFGSNDWGGTSQAEMDSNFAAGTYQFVVQGTNISLNLTGNVYPNIPLATLTGGVWSNGVYLMDAGNALTITTVAFTGYGSNIDGRIFIYPSYLPNDGLPVSYHSSAPASNSLTFTVPPNTLASGQINTMFIGFDAIVSTNAALAGSYNVAYYEKVTKFQVVTLPRVSVQPASGGKLEITFTGVLQQSSDLRTWSDVVPQPTSPWQVPVGVGNEFFRVVTGN
jgi:hypothetical protein